MHIVVQHITGQSGMTAGGNKLLDSGGIAAILFQEEVLQIHVKRIIPQLRMNASYGVKVLLFVCGQSPKILLPFPLIALEIMLVGCGNLRASYHSLGFNLGGKRLLSTGAGRNAKSKDTGNNSAKTPR